MRPVLSPKVAQRVKRRPKTPARLALQLLMRLMRWLPQRKFVLLGDSLVVTHRTAEFARRHADRVTAIGRLRADANLYAPPGPRRRSRAGRPAKKGKKLPSPAQQVAQLTPVSREVCWYGNRRRTVSFVAEQALWHDKQASAVTPIRWVCVRGDKEQGTLDAYFYSSDPQMEAWRIVELYASRWNIEVTFEESRALLGLETTRHWCNTVPELKDVPLIFGLFTAVALMWTRLPACKRRCRSGTPCYAKTAPTFADALFAVRRELWRETLLVRHRGHERCLDTLPKALRETLLWHLAAAA